MYGVLEGYVDRSDSVGKDEGEVLLEHWTLQLPVTQVQSVAQLFTLKKKKNMR